MEQEKAAVRSAWFRDLELKVWGSNFRYFWSVRKSATAEVIAQGEAATRESAMVAASEAAQADWGTVRWRGSEDDG